MNSEEKYAELMMMLHALRIYSTLDASLFWEFDRLERFVCLVHVAGRLAGW